MKNRCIFAINCMILTLSSTYIFSSSFKHKASLVFTPKAAEIFKKSIDKHFPRFEEASQISKSPMLLNKQLTDSRLEQALKSAESNYQVHVWDSYLGCLKRVPMNQRRMFSAQSYPGNLFGFDRAIKRQEKISLLIIAAAQKAKYQETLKTFNKISKK